MSYKIVIVGNGSEVLSKKNGKRIDSFDYIVRMGSCPIKGYEDYVGTRTDMLRLSWNRIISIERNIWAEYLYEKKKDYYRYLGHDAEFKDLLLIENDPDLYYERSCLGSYNHLRKIFRRIPSWPTSLRDKPFIHIPERMLHDAILEFFKKDKKIQNIHYFNINDRVNFFQEFNYFTNLNKIIVPSNGLMTIYFVRKMFSDAEIYVTGFDGFKTPFYWQKEGIKNTIHNAGKERLVYTKMLKQELFYEL